MSQASAAEFLDRVNTDALLARKLAAFGEKARFEDVHQKLLDGDR